MSVVIQIVAAADGTLDAAAGKYIKEYSADGYGGRGHVLLTENLKEARRFPDMPSAHLEWAAVSRTHPVRPDGEPNRPLTAYSVVLLWCDTEH